jgi:hypothetical protein
MTWTRENNGLSIFGPKSHSSQQLIGQQITFLRRKETKPNKTVCMFVSGRGASGLPDGLFSNQKTQFGQIFEGLTLENVVTYFMDIGNNFNEIL